MIQLTITAMGSRVLTPAETVTSMEAELFHKVAAKCAQYTAENTA